MKGIGIALSFIIVLFIACSYNPQGSLPPVTHYQSFDECVEALSTPAHTAMWLEEFSLYSNPYTGWDCPHGKDLAWELAYALWDNYIDGNCRGKCASFAAMYIVCAREHGYECGIICYWTAVSGHAIGWVRDGDGTVGITNNQEYTPGLYENTEQMYEYYEQRYGNICFYDAWWKRIR